MKDILTECQELGTAGGLGVPKARWGFAEQDFGQTLVGASGELISAHL